MSTTDPILASVLEAVLAGCDASAAFVIVERDGEAVTIAAAPPAIAGGTVGKTVADGRAPSLLALASGQPAALQVPAGGYRGPASGTGLDVTAMLCVPAPVADGTSLVIEVVAEGGRSFSFDDVELVDLMAPVAAAAAATTAVRAPSPDLLAGMLRELATVDPARYEVIARAVEALLRLE